MNPLRNLALVGSGPSTIYLLKHLLDAIETLRPSICEISIFEKSTLTGVGMPYSPQTTDRYNLANISSQELPELPLSLADWLLSCSVEELGEMDLSPEDISEHRIYARLVLGRYLNAQYLAIAARLVAAGIVIHEFPGCEIAAVEDHPESSSVTLLTARGDSHSFGHVVIATGHRWEEDDRPESGYYSSPWPIKKLLPATGAHHDFAVGTLGASLSAFDVIVSLAHRHGNFTPQGGRMAYHPHPGTENFRLVMHAAHGRLPHLQFDLEDTARVIYRHVNRTGMLDLVGADGFLRIENYFDVVCRPALVEAFQEDGMRDVADLLEKPDFALRDFVEEMTARHDYDNAFEGMRQEMTEAEQSVLGHRPVHWKETIDDLIYTLNFHAELLPAEDHLVLQSLVMPFLMNVIAAMPLESGHKLLALYDAGKISIIEGKARLADPQPVAGKTTVIVEKDGRESSMDYLMFVDCSGQKPLDLVDYPFSGLVASGTVRKARARFLDPDGGPSSLPEKQRQHLFHDGGEAVYHTGGVDIDATYRLIGADGNPNPRIEDISFPHTSGVRPYSYGLQSCSDTSAILVRAWVEEINSGRPVADEIEESTRILEQI